MADGLTGFGFPQADFLGRAQQFQQAGAATFAQQRPAGPKEPEKTMGGALMTGASTAATGFAVGGPIGAGIGAVVGLAAYALS